MHLFLTSALNGGEWSASFPVTLPLVKEPEFLTEQELGWAQQPVGSIFVEEKSFIPTENGAPDFPGLIIISTPTTKSRLSYVGLSVLKISCLC